MRAQVFGKPSSYFALILGYRFDFYKIAVEVKEVLGGGWVEGGGLERWLGGRGGSKDAEGYGNEGERFENHGIGGALSQLEVGA